MASKIALKNNINSEFEIAHSDGIGAVSVTSKDMAKINPVDTVAALRAMTYTPSTVWLSGYHEAGDGAFGSNIFRWNPESTEADNGGTVIKLDSIATGRYELQFDGAVNVKWFGAVSVENGGGDSKSAFVAALLFKNVYIPNGTYDIDITSGGLTTVVNAVVASENAVLRITHTGVLTSETPATAFTIEDGSSVENLRLNVGNTTNSFADNTSYTNADEDSDASFNYLDYVKAFVMKSNTRLYKCGTSNFWSGVSSDNDSNIVVDGCTIDKSGEWCTSFYSGKNVKFVNNSVNYGGGSGGVAFPSMKNSIISNNYIKVSGTGINPGGSPDVAFNAEDLTITGNDITARDCIVMENGANRASITGNNINCIYSSTTGGGVGIAATSDSSGSFAGYIKNITVVGNSISSYEGAIHSYSFGIKIGSNATDIDSSIEQITIANNTIDNSVVGVFATSGTTAYPILDTIIDGNNITNDGTYGIQLSNMKSLNIANNIVLSNTSTVTAGQRGIRCDECTETLAGLNKIIGFEHGFYLGSTVSTRVYLKDNEILDGRTAGASSGDVTTDGKDTTEYFGATYAALTGGDISPKLTSKFMDITHTGPYTITSLALSNAKVGDTVSIRCDGNVTFQGANIYLNPYNAADTTPPANGIINFMCFYAPSSGSRFIEISRTF